MNIADRFMSNPRRLFVCQFTHHQFSLQENHVRSHNVSASRCVALYIAIKINEQDIFSVEKCAVATHGMYTVEDIEAIGSVQYWSVCHGR